MPRWRILEDEPLQSDALSDCASAEDLAALKKAILENRLGTTKNIVVELFKLPGTTDKNLFEQLLWNNDSERVPLRNGECYLKLGVWRSIAIRGLACPSLFLICPRHATDGLRGRSQLFCTAASSGRLIAGARTRRRGDLEVSRMPEGSTGQCPN